MIEMQHAVEREFSPFIYQGNSVDDVFRKFAANIKDMCVLSYGQLSFLCYGKNGSKLVGSVDKLDSRVTL